MQISQELARAKINLFLHVGAKQADGYHPICSLMVFADIGDRLRLTSAASRGFFLRGPFAGALAGGGANLVTDARDLFLERFPQPTTSFALTLEKQLPIAAGLGGGSADAAATLRLLAARYDVDVAHPALEAIARRLGADVAACLAARTLMAQGRGDTLSTAPALPRLDAVLVNPGAPSSTPAVYDAFDALPSGAGADRPVLPASIGSARDAAALFATLRNDLEAPASALQPLIGDALDALAAQPESLLARMSGSGATCFALTETAAAAHRLAAHLSARHPAWWVRACRLGGP